MTYYEELGVDPTASAEEIRRAYRKLAQLLHPDHQQDETLRRICERQSARLNGIAEILEDPQRREEYDAELRQRDRSGAPAPGTMARGGESIGRPGVTAWVWAIAAVAGIALMALLFRWNAASAGDTPYRTEGSREQADAAPVVRSAAQPVVGAGFGGTPASPKRPRSSHAPVPPSRREPVAAASDITASRPPLVAEPALVAPPKVFVTAAATPQEAANGLRQQQSYFAGNWFYWPNVSKRDAALYPPEKIEVAITEENGVLHGRYRSRYRVADQPISPDVNFEFGGPAGSEDHVDLTWDGAEGAAGQIRLKAITPVSMEASWWATQMGGLDLASGTAVLIRAREK